MKGFFRSLALIVIGFLFGVAFLQILFRIEPSYIPVRPYVAPPEVPTVYEPVLVPTGEI